MGLVITVLVIVLVVQGGIFYYSRKLKQRMKENDVLSKYNINSRSELFASLGNMDIPESDRIKLEAIYNGEEDE